MKAAWFEGFGAAAEVIHVGEMPPPRCGAGEVLVRVRASAINPSDTKKRAGAMPTLLADGPVIPDSDGAGVIEAVGESVPATRVGERVWVYQAQHDRRLGSAAEYLAIDSRRAVPLPDGVGFDVGACMGIPAMTAHRCVHADGPVRGQVLLVTGGAGRVGYYAIQFAKLAGATVIATAHGERGERDCREAGADHVVDHRAPGWHRSVLEATGGARVDRCIDVEFGANLAQVLEVVRTGAVIATYSSTVVPEPALPFRRMMWMDLTVRMVIVYSMPEQAKDHAALDITEALRGGRLRHRIARRFPLDQYVAASEAIERGGLNGCVVVEV